MRITRELRSDINHLSINLEFFTDIQVGKFIRAVLRREQRKDQGRRKRIQMAQGKSFKPK